MRANPSSNLRVLPHLVGRSAQRMRGMTLVELLAVLAIGILISCLLLPAVQSARERSRLMQCQTNLVQLGLAIANYETSHRVLPHGVLYQQTSEFGFEYVNEFGVLPRILNELDEGSLAARIRWESNLVDQRLLSESDGLPSPLVARCPSDWLSGPSSTSYRFCAGVRIDFFDAAWPKLGAFGSSPRLLSRITDGLSHTAFVSERLVGSGVQRRTLPSETPVAYDDGDIRRDFAIASVNSSDLAIGPDAFSHLCSQALLQQPAWQNWLGAPWYSGQEAYYTHVLPPNSRVPDCGFIATFPRSGIISTRSQHRGGVSVVNGDSSVHFISDSIDRGLWRGMATISESDATPVFD